jgi:3',5'-cyclic AMP phosphodiesterase CpdA
MHKSKSKLDNRNAAALVERILGQFKAAPKTKTYVVLSGDCVDDSAANQYRQLAKTVLAPLSEKFTVLAAPGNHDYAYAGNFYTPAGRTRFLKYMWPYVRRLHYPCRTSNRAERVVLIGLDSADPGDERWFAEGVIGEKQLAKLHRILQDQRYAGYFKVLYLHHHPFFRDVGLALHDSQELLKVISEQVDLVLFGHKHKGEAYFGRFRVPLMLASGKVTEARGEALVYRVIQIDKGKLVDVWTEEIPSAESTPIYV